MKTARPPDPAHDCAPDGETSEARGLTTAAGDGKSTTGPRWQVQVINPATGRPKVWDFYDSRERAEHVAATLRHHGFCAQVRHDEPEYRADRRAFLIAMFAIGAVPTERVVERVVADLKESAP